ncbi:DUF3726 domain-containing protein [uncultured Roseobacter sp.]|uniref:DUF3726 domain-containing protein n=1 Tax=uncultured Roseobacter sp. TaxID=114847 RepID=UPI0026297076|nr:DUF3726 domain-containing protein [uncultured Roseobacter sp.]
MTHSLNEIEAQSRKAARGTGLSWGMAEEAAKATRWLESHQLPGVRLLAEVLTRNDGVAHADIAPQTLDAPWTARSGVLCPLASGAALNDCADRLATGHHIEMEDVTSPLLIVPFAAWAALHIRSPVRVQWPDIRIETDGYRIWVNDPKAQVGLASKVALTCSRVSQMNQNASLPELRGRVCPTGWDILCTFAHRTYAPDTPESRRLGAGAGVSDND